MTQSISIPEWCLARFAEFEQSLNGTGDSAWHALRRRAFAAFQELGIPSPHVEEWKYTSLLPFLREPLILSQSKVKKSALDEIAARCGAESGPRAVFVNGWFAPELSQLGNLPRGVRCRNLAEVMSAAGGGKPAARTVDQHLARYAACGENALAALNTAFLRDGLLLMVERGVAWDQPLQLVFVDTETAAPHAAFPRVLILLEEGAAAGVIERQISLGEQRAFVCGITEVRLGRGAMLEHHRVVAGGRGAYYGLLQGALAAGAGLRLGSFTFGGELVRNEIRLDLDGAGIDCGLVGLTVLDGQQHADNHIVLRHKQPNSQSRQAFKGIYAGRSCGVFSGTIIVDPDAQKTNAYQSNQSVLLSDTARSDTRPQLKIWADDVKCSHGATVGRLDDEALFYLRSRGLPEKIARDLLVRAFAGEVVSQVRLPLLAKQLEELMQDKLGQITVL